MHLRLSLLAAMAIGSSVILPAATWAAESDAAMNMVRELAQINGQALACQDTGTAAKAKTLMLAHAPKTPRFGTLFEETTNASYLEQVRGTAACPDAVAVSRRLEDLAQRMREALPVAASQ